MRNAHISEMRSNLKKNLSANVFWKRATGLTLCYFTLCLQLPNRKSVVNYFNKSSYFCSDVYKSNTIFSAIVL
jgi:hypothetical protein